jgi:transcription elongation factor GreA
METVKMTQGHKEELIRKLDTLTDERNETLNEIEAARKLGDLSENADYSTALDKKATLDGQIAELQAQIDNAEIVQGIVYTVLRSNDKATKIYSLGGEPDPDQGKISFNSPIGKAISNHKVGDVVTVEVAHPYTLTILKIEALKE